MNMRRHNQNYDYQHYPFLPPTGTTTSRNTHYQYYDRRLRTQNNIYANSTPIPVYASPRSQYQSQSSIIISDLGEPISAFHDIEPPPYNQNRVTSLPVVHKPQSVNRYSSMSDERLARASAMRERLLKNIQQNIDEIDEELSSLKKRPSLSHHIPLRLTPLVNMQPTSVHKNIPSPNEENLNWPNKTKKAYQVVPRISSDRTKASSVSTPQITVNFPADSFVGQYHYGPEVDEIEIHARDPENIDLKSNYDEISQFNFHETFSVNQFIREQSDLPQNRALISVPEYVDNYNIKMNESTEELDENGLVDTNSVRPSTVTSVHDSALVGKLSIQDFQSLIQTAPEQKIELPLQPKIELPPEPIHHNQEPIEETNLNAVNTILSKPLRHSRLSIRTQDTLSIKSQTMKNHDSNAINDRNYFFSEFGNDFEGEEDLISIDPYNFAPPTESELISEDNKSITVRRQSQTSLLNPHATQQHQHIENNNQYVEETEKKKIDAMAKQSVTAISTPPSMKMRPTSIDDDIQTKFEKNNNNSDEHQRQTLAAPLYMNLDEQFDDIPSNDLSIGVHSSLSASQQKLSNRISSKNVTPTDERSRSISKQSDYSRQRSASLRRSSRKQSNDLLSREQSYISLSDHEDITATMETQDVLDSYRQKSIGSRRNSEIPIPLTSPDLNDIPASKSRTTSPSRRNSVSSLDQTMLLTSDDILDLENATTDIPQAISSEQPNLERKEPSSPIDSLSLHENQHNNNNHNDTYELQLELSSNQNQNESNDRKSLLSSLDQNQDELIDVNPLRSSSYKNQDEIINHTISRSSSQHNQDEFLDHSVIRALSQQNQDELINENLLRSSSSHSQDDMIELKSSLSSSNQNSGEIKDHNLSQPPPSVENLNELTDDKQSQPSSSTSKVKLVDRNSSQLSSNQSQTQFMDQNPLQSSANYEHNDSNRSRPYSHQNSGELTNNTPSRMPLHQNANELQHQNSSPSISHQNPDDSAERNLSRSSSHQNPGDLSERNPSRLSSHLNPGDLSERNPSRLSSHLNPSDSAERNLSRLSSHQNPGDLSERNPSRLSSHLNPGDLSERNPSRLSSHLNPSDSAERNLSRLSSHQNPGDLSDRNPSRLSSHQNPGDLSDRNPSRLSSHQNPGDLSDRNPSRLSSHQNSGDLTERNTSKLSPHHTAGDLSDRNPSRLSSHQNPGDLSDRNPSRLSSHQNPGDLSDRNPSRLSSHQNSGDLTERNTSKLSPHHTAGDLSERNPSRLSSNHAEGDLSERNLSRSSSHQNPGDLSDRNPSRLSSHQNSGDLTERNTSKLSPHHTAGDLSERNPSRLSSHHAEGDLSGRNPSRLSSHQNPGDSAERNLSRSSSHQNPGDLSDRNPSRLSSHQNSGDLTERNTSKLSPHHTAGDLSERNPSRLSSHQNPGDLVERNPSGLSSNQNEIIGHSLTRPSLHRNADDLLESNPSGLSSHRNPGDLTEPSPSKLSSHQNPGDLVERNPSGLSSNQNEIISHSLTRPPSHRNTDDLVERSSSGLSLNQNLDGHTYHQQSASIHEQKHNRSRSVSPLTMEVKKVDDDDLHLASFSPRHSDISGTKLTSVGREDTFRQPTSPDYTASQTEKPASRSSKSKLGFDTELRDENKYSDSQALFLTEEPPFITESQRRSKLSLLIRGPRIHQNNFTRSEDLQRETGDFASINTNRKSKQQQQQQHVSYADNIESFEIKENNGLQNWRERINAVLAKNHSTNNKYSHVPSRVNTFANFEHQPKKLLTVPKRKSRAKVTSNFEMDNKTNKLKKSKNKSEQEIIPYKEPPAEVLGRLLSLPDGRAKIFSEKLKWNRKSKIRSYSLENFHHKPQQSHVKIFNKKPKWHSESKLADLIKTSPRRQAFTEVNSLKPIPDNDEPTIYYDEAQFETKIFDINSNVQPLISDIPENSTDDTSFDFKRPSNLIFHKKIIWRKKSKLKDMIWKNIDYTPKQSEVKIFHQAVHWNSESRLRITHSLNLGNREKIKYWSEINLPRLKEKKALFSQYYDSKWNDVITDNIEATIKIDPLIEPSNLTDYTEENINNRLQNEIESESPANRPKWNSVSKSRSLNLIYNPKLTNANTIRRGWDLELRRKRVHRLPPLKRKRDHDKTTPLSLEDPPLNHQLAIEYHDDHSLATDQIANIDYATITSDRSSKALVPLRHVPNLDLSSETPRSQRPIQQEWYDEMNKSRLTHRTDMGRTTHNSFRDSIISVHQANTPRELQTLRSSTRNSQNSVMSGTLLDSSIRTNRATELRLSKDMDQHHQHSHDPSQSMPIEIRGFRLEGTQLNVPDHATIRPLSNISYQASERVKHRRAYPWSTLHPHGTPSRNSSLLPIAEYRHPSFQTSIVETPPLVHDE